MAIKNTKNLFIMLLSNLRQGTERSTKMYQELTQLAQYPEVKQALEARVYISEKTLSTLDQCFKLMSEEPIKTSGRLQEVFAEDFHKELAEIQSPEAKSLYVLVKASHLAQMRIGEYTALIAAADVTGHYGVGVLLESCLADKIAFVERTRRLVRHSMENETTERRAA